ncbi:hypothetical protein Dimus_033750 [Dionaea muscipula]
MWSLCLLINKLLNLEEGEEHGFNEKDSSLIGSCLLKLSSIDGLNNDVVLPDCRIIEHLDCGSGVHIAKIFCSFYLLYCDVGRKPRLLYREILQGPIASRFGSSRQVV